MVGVRRWLKRLLARRVTADALGRRGERAADRALRSIGYRVLARRVRLGGAEVDLLALDGETLVVVEVKASRGTAPARRVGAAKRRRLARAWTALARDAALAARPRRLDVVEVVLGGGPPRCRVLRGFARLASRGGNGRA